MDEYSPLGFLVRQWASYLQVHGHHVEEPAQPGMLTSRNGQRRRYRWLFRRVDGNSILLTLVDRKRISRQLRLGQISGETVYLVIKFEEPSGKVLVVPAAEAIKVKRLCSDKGGIPWGP